ncbi:MAG: DUF2892 domain-containing protein [Chitinophagaceae bacterium]|nr:DUF2892 domain-containing protein [Chitinophagaceae bacterium]
MLTTFNRIRWIRLVAGAVALYQGIVSYSTILGAMGVLLLIQGIFNMGCPGLSCSQPYRQTNASNAEEIKFEEIK